MKSKLTLTIDEELIPRAKAIARARGVSLSQLVESSLRDLDRGAGESFSARWCGRFAPSSRDDPRYLALAKKYL